jgi:ElaB/YqjD/DUF883 family membrane-anchored ribosome-binding protein
MEMAMTDSPLTPDKLGEAKRHGNGAHLAEDAIKRGQDAFKHGLETSKDKIGEAADLAASRIEDAHSYVTRQAREKPVQTTAIALGAGVLLGMFLSGRRR